MVLLVVSNTVYQLCAKSVPKGINPINPFASLIVTYLIGAAASLVLYFVLGSDGNLLKEYGKLNWAPFVLGIVIVGLEAGWIYAYKAGWQVSTGFIVQSAFLAMSLLLVGYFIFREALTWNKVVGVAICLVGLIFTISSELLDTFYTKDIGPEGRLSALVRGALKDPYPRFR